MASHAHCKILGLVALAILAGCQTDAAPSPAAPVAGAVDAVSSQLWLNDVSILLPLSHDKEFVGRALWAQDVPAPQKYAPGQPALPTDGQAFLPDWAMRALDQQLSADAAAQGIPRSGLGAHGIKPLLEERFFLQQEDFINVGVRLLPCPNSVFPPPDPQACQSEIRLIWQPINTNDASPGGMRISDQDIETVYHLEAADLQAVATGLRQLQQLSGLDYADLPLGEHPAMVAQGVNGSYFRGVLGILHRYVRASRLTAVLGFGNTQATTGGVATWPMTMVTLAHGQVQIPTPLPGLLLAQPTPRPRYVQRLFPPLGRPGSAEPGAANPDSWLRAGAGGAGLNTKGANLPEQSLQTEIGYIEDPRRSLAQHLDCATCHTAQLVRRELGDIATPSISQLEFRLPGWNSRNATKPETAATALQMFSFDAKSGLPVIAQRTINESIAAAVYMNTLLQAAATPKK